MTAIYTPERSDYQHVLTAYTAPGKISVGGTLYQKARLWVLEDRQVIIVRNHPSGRGVERIALGATTLMTRTGRRSVIAELESGETLSIEEASCACGMGAAGSAGPVEGRWKIERVRRPEWFVEAA